MIRATHCELAVLIALSLTTVAIAQNATESPATAAAADVSPDLGRLGDGDGPHWDATADALFLQRSAPSHQQLLYDPGSGSEVFNASNLDFSTAAGPRLSLRRDDPTGLGVELTYFGIDGWKSSANVPNAAFLYGVGYLSIDDTMTVPVSDAQFQYSSRLYSGELNFRYSLNDWLTPLVGFRWVDFEDRYAASGQLFSGSGSFADLVRGHNHLYGSQIGLDARLYDRGGPVKIDLLAKAGLYDNAAVQDNDYATTGMGPAFSATASDSHLSFLGEIGVNVSYQFTKHLALRGGYQVMWLTGVAMAPNQIAATDFGAAQAGVDTSATLFCHGANAGLELAW
jgi:hypothetical protein